MSKIIVDIHEAKIQLSLFIARAEAGETLVIAEAGMPNVMLTPLPQQARRRSGRFAGLITLGADFSAPLPEVDLAAWEGAPEEL
jgi:antitoxin (DNA-binding transcriptional repressor) of toxin-antitoxin stability system